MHWLDQEAALFTGGSAAGKSEKEKTEEKTHRARQQECKWRVEVEKWRASSTIYKKYFSEVRYPLHVSIAIN